MLLRRTPTSTMASAHCLCKVDNEQKQAHALYGHSMLGHALSLLHVQRPFVKQLQAHMRPISLTCRIVSLLCSCKPTSPSRNQHGAVPGTYIGSASKQDFLDLHMSLGQLLAGPTEAAPRVLADGASCM